MFTWEDSCVKLCSNKLNLFYVLFAGTCFCFALKVLAVWVVTSNWRACTSKQSRLKLQGSFNV